jgi:predicted DNA-binding ribbon-helix-helix protein
MTKQKQIKASSAPSQGGTRLSVTLPADHYREMQHFAARKKVSMAWVVRDAVDQYLAAHGEPGARSGSSRKSHPQASGKGAA